MSRREQPKPPGMEPESLLQQARHTIEEARMVLPGIQGLFGFQLIAVFNARFVQLPSHEQYLHFDSLLLVTLSIALSLTPAAYHRLVERGGVSPFFIEFASRLMAAAMSALLLAIVLDVLLVGWLILGEGWSSFGIAGGVFCVFAFLWFIYPFRAALERSSRIYQISDHKLCLCQ